ncbi:MAG: hypothetical protein PVG07_03755 [Acidobacteriota bacterium]
MSEERVLLMRRDGGLWGIVHDEVRTVTRGRDGYRIWLRQEELTADDVLGVIEDLRVWPAGGVLSRYWNETAGGLAVHDSIPLVMVDPERPPAIFRRDTTRPTETSHGDDDDNRSH